jgi:sec-independent protein translocase protein TatC
MKSSASPPGGPEQPFISHLLELRDRLLRGMVAVVVVLVVLLPFSNDIYTLLARPLLKHMPEGATMIATEVASPFLIPFKLTLFAAIVLAIPFLLYQLWAFVAPGLYQNERRIMLPLLASSTVLFYLGMAFAYYVVFPLAFGFFTSTAPEGVTVMTDISKYLDFVSVVFLAFGIAFEVPVATVLLVWVGVTTPDQLAAKRPYIVVGAFVVGAFLTPPDVISQTLLAVPMWVLFELGVAFSRFLPRLAVEAEDENDPQTHGSALAGSVPAGFHSAELDIEEELRGAEAEEERLARGDAAEAGSGAGSGGAPGRNDKGPGAGDS